MQEDEEARQKSSGLHAASSFAPLQANAAMLKTIGTIIDREGRKQFQGIKRGVREGGGAAKMRTRRRVLPIAEIPPDTVQVINMYYLYVYFIILF